MYSDYNNTDHALGRLIEQAWEAMGRPVPLLRALEITPETHGPRGLGYANPPEPVAPLSARFAPQLIVDEARRRPGELTLVTLGPLTNLAIAVLMEPALPRLLRRWIAMGGAFRVPGNTTPVSEWNVHCDPEAARIVFRSGLPITMPFPATMYVDYIRIYQWNGQGEVAFGPPTAQRGRFG